MTELYSKPDTRLMVYWNLNRPVIQFKNKACKINFEYPKTIKNNMCRDERKHTNLDKDFDIIKGISKSCA